MRLVYTALLAALAVPAAAQDFYVDANAAAGGDGLSWATATDDLQKALDDAAAAGGGTVHVGFGPYSGDFVIPAGVEVLGGYVATDPNGRHPKSILQRSFQARTTILAASARAVEMKANSTLDGFWVQFGQAGSPGGGGILIDGVDATVRNCFIRLNNDSVGAGAALLVRNGASPRIENSVFTLNGDPASGAAIEVDGAGGTYVNLTIDSNEHSGLRLSNGATPAIYNSIFSNNGALSGATAYGIEADAASSPILEHNLFFNNNSGHYLDGGTPVMTVAQLNALGYAQNNIEGDPKFEVAGSVWRLQADSPAIDVGHPTEFAARPQGLYDQPRRLDGRMDGLVRVDIGAAEFSNIILGMPVDSHTHVHAEVSGTPGLPVCLIIGTNAHEGGIFYGFAGRLFVDPFGSVVLPYFTVPTPPGVAIDYPSPAFGTPGTPTYWQALTTNGIGVAISNPTVHLSN
ncbi:MAG: right-handed parallel beta-helix repeat-containing protein [Planctomycetota bacterium]